MGPGTWEAGGGVLMIPTGRVALLSLLSLQGLPCPESSLCRAQSSQRHVVAFLEDKQLS